MVYKLLFHLNTDHIPFSFLANSLYFDWKLNNFVYNQFSRFNIFSIRVINEKVKLMVTKMFAITYIYEAPSITRIHPTLDCTSDTIATNWLNETFDILIMRQCPISHDLLNNKPFLCFINLKWIFRDSKRKYVKALYTYTKCTVSVLSI